MAKLSVQTVTQSAPHMLNIITVCARIVWTIIDVNYMWMYSILINNQYTLLLQPRFIKGTISQQYLEESCLCVCVCVCVCVCACVCVCVSFTNTMQYLLYKYASLKRYNTFPPYVCTHCLPRQDSRAFRFLSSLLISVLYFIL